MRFEGPIEDGSGQHQLGPECEVDVRRDSTNHDQHQLSCKASSAGKRTSKRLQIDKTATGGARSTSTAARHAPAFVSFGARGISNNASIFTVMKDMRNAMTTTPLTI